MIFIGSSALDTVTSSALLQKTRSRVLSLYHDDCEHFLIEIGHHLTECTSVHRRCSFRHSKGEHDTLIIWVNKPIEVEITKYKHMIIWIKSDIIKKSINSTITHLVSRSTGTRRNIYATVDQCYILHKLSQPKKCLECLNAHFEYLSEQQLKLHLLMYEHC